MRISMWMLADWLKSYAPVARIEQGSRVLRNARLYSEELKISRSSVYLHQVEDSRVLCTNGHDVLELRSQDVNAVLGDTMDAFEYYNDWAAGVHDLIHDGCDAQTILRAGAQALGRTLILADATFFVREIFDPFETIARTPSVGNMTESRLLPLEALLDLSRLECIRVPELPSYRVDPAGVEPGAVVTNLFCGDVHKGWLITVKPSGEYTRGEYDLQDAFAELLTLWLQRGESAEGRMDKSGILLELLAHPGERGQGREERLQTFGWYASDPKQLFVVRQLADGRDPMHAEERYLERINPYAFLAQYGGRLVMLANLRLTPPERFSGEFGLLLRRCGCVAGASGVFTELDGFAAQYESALAALRFAPEEAGAVRAFEDVKLPYIASLLRTQTLADLSHPALRQLRAYDERHGTSLAETLRVFLRCRCSYAETAQALFIHRSTLLYRLGRVRELTGADPEDADTRLHLELSFLMEP